MKPEVCYRQSARLFRALCVFFTILLGTAGESRALSLPPLPTVRLLSPQTGAWFPTNSSIELRAHVFMPHGTELRAVRFESDGKVLGFAEIGPSPGVDWEVTKPFLWTRPPVGNHKITAIGTNTVGGLSIVSDPIYINVGEPTATNTPSGSFFLTFFNASHGSTEGALIGRSYTFAGTSVPGPLLPGLAAISDRQGHYYVAEWPQALVVDGPTGKAEPILRDVSWPMGAAYDSKRSRIVVVSLEGDGFLHARTTNGWTVIRNLGGRDFDSLVYHHQQDALFGLETFGGSPLKLTKLSPSGEFLEQMSFAPLPQPISYAHYRSELAVSGENLALVIEPRANAQISGLTESRIYHVDLARRAATLTFKKSWTNWPPQPAPTQPQPRITSPRNGNIIPEGVEISIMVEVLDAGHDVRTVELFSNQHKIGTANQVLTFAPTQGQVFSFDWRGAPAGRHSLQARAVDAQGSAAWSAGVVITVTNSGVQIPDFRVNTRFLANGQIIEKTYTKNGPVDGGPLIPGLRMIGGENRYLFGAEPHKIVRYDRELKRAEEITQLPANLPELSWPMGAAFDTTRNRAVVVTLGGEGYLYQYHYASNRWSVLSSMNNRDFESLVYHRHTDSFFGAEVSRSFTGNTDVTISQLNQRGEFFDSMQIKNVPFNLWHDARSELLPLDNMLLLFLEGDPRHAPANNYAAYRESRIYWVNPHAKTYQLVWQKVWSTTNRPPAVRLVSPIAGATFDPGAPIHFAIHAEDPDHNLRQVEVLANGQVIGLAAAAVVDGPSNYNYSFTWRNAPVGTNVIVIRARDAEGVVAQTSPVAFRVLSRPAHPVRITFPAQGQIFTNPASITLTTIVDAPFTNPTQVSFLANGHHLGAASEVHTADLVSGRMFRFTWHNPAPGAYRLVARAQQDRMVADSLPVEITVRSQHATNLPPIVELVSPPSGSVYPNGASVEFAASARDLDGHIERVEFYASQTYLGAAVQVPPGSTNAFVYRFVWANPPTGRHDISAVAVDNKHARAVSGSNWIVINPLVLTNVARILSPTNGAVFDNPEQVRIAASVNARMPFPDKVEFLANGQLLGIGTEIRVSPEPDPLYGFTWQVPPAGVHRLMARAIKGTNATASQIVEITVRRNTGTNQPGSVRITSPQNGATFTNAQPVQVYALTEGPIAQNVEILANGRLIGRATPNPAAFSPGFLWQFAWTNAPHGTHILQAFANFGGGKTNVSDPVTIHVVGPRQPLLVVTRMLPPTYVGGKPLQVRLNAQPTAAVSAYAVEDAIPQGWIVSSVSHQGAYDSVTGKVKFGPFRDRQTRELTYIALPPEGAVKTYVFAGNGSANGVDFPIGGDSVTRPAESRHPADNNSADDRITLNELTAYAAEWNERAGVPISYVTWAGTLWKAGEAYRFDPSRSGPPMWWVPAIQRIIPFSSEEGSATRALTSTTVAGAIIVTINAQPSSTTTSFAVEEGVPAGWDVSAISNDGAFISGENVVRWGPFLDNEPRELTFTASPGAAAGAAVFTGVASFDGATEFILGPAQPEPLALKVSANASGSVTLSFTPAPAGATVVLESAATLDGHWETVTATSDSATHVITEPASARQRFYRLRVE